MIQIPITPPKGNLDMIMYRWDNSDREYIDTRPEPDPDTHPHCCSYYVDKPIPSKVIPCQRPVVSFGDNYNGLDRLVMTTNDPIVETFYDTLRKYRATMYLRLDMLDCEGELDPYYLISLVSPKWTCWRFTGSRMVRAEGYASEPMDQVLWDLCIDISEGTQAPGRIGRLRRKDERKRRAFWREHKVDDEDYNQNPHDPGEERRKAWEDFRFRITVQE